MSSELPPLAPGAVIDARYRIEEMIGQGGFGAVFRATQLTLARSVALKVLHADVLERDGLLRFQREAELVQRLTHPNTVRLLDFGRLSEESPYLVFELLTGVTLERAIQEGPMQPARVARIAGQMLKALMEAHALGIVHRDIKPANVFLSNFQGETDFVKLLDFGIAKSTDSRSLTRTGHIVGTPAYISPEQVLSRPATFATDLYAVGLVMAEALSGKAVYKDLSLVEIVREHLSTAAVPLPAAVLSGPLGPIVQRATLKDPERRYGSAASMLGHIEAAMRGGAPPVSVIAPIPSPPLGGTSSSPPSVRIPVYVSPSQRPAPPKPRGKRQGKPWVLGGVLVVAAVTGATVLAVLHLVSKGSVERPPVADAGVVVEVDGGQIQPVATEALRFTLGGEGRINADAVPDFTAVVSSYLKVDAKLCAVDGATFKFIWCSPIQLSSGVSAFDELTGHAAVFIDGGAKVHLFELGAGKEYAVLALKSRVTYGCLPRDAPDALWVATEDKHGFLIDTAARTIREAPEWPSSCPHPSPLPWVCRFDVQPKICPPHVEHPGETKDFSFGEADSDGVDGIVTGERRPGSVQEILGFAVGPKPTVRWRRAVGPNDGLGATDPVGSPLIRILNGKATVGYTDLKGVIHLQLIDARTGAALWDAPVGRSIKDVTLTAHRMYLATDGAIQIRDPATGRLIGRLGSSED